MPGVPSSKACDACRKQKKGCDQTKPACSRCLRLNKECVGGGRQRFKFTRHSASAVEHNVLGNVKFKATARVPDYGRSMPLELERLYEDLSPQSTKAEPKLCISNPSSISHQHLQHDHHLAPSFLVQPSFCNLGSQQAQYFDRFRYQVVYRLGSHLFDEFWLRSVLRESARDNCVLEMVLGIGALSYALENAPRDIPLYKAPFSSHPSGSFYAEAIRYYGSSLARIRRRFLPGQLEAPTRTVLISSLLFSAFEVLQGSSISSDQIMANSVWILKDKIMQCAWPDKKSQIAAAYDDKGVEDAEFILMRRLCFRSLLSPCPQGLDSISNCDLPYSEGPCPSDQNHDFKDFWKLWMRFLTLALTWYARVDLSVLTENPVCDIPWLQEEQRSLLAQIKDWESSLELSLDREADPYGRQILKQIEPGLKTLYFCIYTVFDHTTESDSKACNLAREILGMAKSILGRTPVSQGGLGEVCEGIQCISIKLSQRCQDREVRFQAISIAKRVINIDSQWDAKGILMGTIALVTLEEAGRIETGAIPLTSRYNWIQSSWNDNHTALSTTFRARGAKNGELREDIQMTLRPKDFGLA